MAYRAFEVMPEVARAAPVTAEPLEAFLRTSQRPLQAVEAQEAWARAHLKLPRRGRTRCVGNGQRAGGCRPAQELSRGHAPVTPEPLCALRSAGPLGGGAHTEPSLDWAQAASVPPLKGPCIGCGRCGQVSRCRRWPCWPRPVTKPDYGLDLQLFDDNPGSPSGYGFGKQPFGNPAVAIGSQAPFHMGFLHQGRVFDTLAPSLTRSLVELRVVSSARWRGWRLARVTRTGAGALRALLRTMQDLTSPITPARPRASLPGMLWANTAAALGMPAAKQALVIPAGNRHFALEQLQARWILNAARRPSPTPSVRCMTRASTRPALSPAVVARRGPTRPGRRPTPPW